MKGARGLAVCLVRRDEGSDGNGGRVGKEFRDLSTWGYQLAWLHYLLFLFPLIGLQLARSRRNVNGVRMPNAFAIEVGKWVRRAYLSDPPDVLVPALLVETQILVQTESHIVTIKSVRCEPLVEKVLLQGSSNGGFARGREASEPDCQAALLAVCIAFAAGQRRVPCDVTSELSV